VLCDVSKKPHCLHLEAVEDEPPKDKASHRIKRNPVFHYITNLRNLLITLGTCSYVLVLMLNREGNCEPLCVEQTECVLPVHGVTATVCLHSVPRCKLLC